MVAPFACMVYAIEALHPVANHLITLEVMSLRDKNWCISMLLAAAVGLKW